MKSQGQGGFTLVEVMVAVVIIGLLLALAIPSFQKVRTASIEESLIKDAKLLGSAAQQYMMEVGASSVTSDKLVGTDADKYVTTLSRRNEVSNFANVNSSYTTQAFQMQNFALPVGKSTLTFDSEGNHTAGGSLD